MGTADIPSSTRRLQLCVLIRYGRAEAAAIATIAPSLPSFQYSKAREARSTILLAPLLANCCLLHGALYSWL